DAAKSGGPAGIAAGAVGERERFLRALPAGEGGVAGLGGRAGDAADEGCVSGDGGKRGEGGGGVVEVGDIGAPECGEVVAGGEQKMFGVFGGQIGVGECETGAGEIAGGGGGLSRPGLDDVERLAGEVGEIACGGEVGLRGGD